MNERQRLFLERLALRIPVLFEAIRQGNHKSEFVVGSRVIESRTVRLKIVAEVVDSRINPLATHGVSPSGGALSSSDPLDVTGQTQNARMRRNTRGLKD